MYLKFNMWKEKEILNLDSTLRGRTYGVPRHFTIPFGCPSSFPKQNSGLCINHETCTDRSLVVVSRNSTSPAPLTVCAVTCNCSMMSSNAPRVTLRLVPGGGGRAASGPLKLATGLDLGLIGSNHNPLCYKG